MWLEFPSRFRIELPITTGKQKAILFVSTDVNISFSREDRRWNYMFGRCWKIGMVVVVLELLIGFFFVAIIFNQEAVMAYNSY